MKPFLLFFYFALIGNAFATPINVQYLRVGGTYDSGTGQVTGGTTYTNGQTIWVECGTSSILVSVPIVQQYSAYWNKSSNFSLSAVGGFSFIQTVQLDASKNDGFVTVLYREGTQFSASALAVYIKQKPPVPTVTASNVCAGNSATFSASSSYPLQGTKPMRFVWQTTGGVTVNSNSSYTSPSGTSSSVTIANSSSGTYSVKAEVPGCGNLQSLPVTGDLGTPTIKNPNYWLFDAGSNMWQFSQQSGYPAVSYNFYVASGSASLSPNYGDCYITTTTGASVCVTGSNTCGTGTPYCFYIPGSGGMLRAVSPNPAQDQLSLEFNNAETIEGLPSVITIYAEKSTKPVKSVSVKEVFERKSFIDGNKIGVSVGDLPRGTYFLHLVPPAGSKSDTQKIRVVLN